MIVSHAVRKYILKKAVNKLFIFSDTIIQSRIPMAENHKQDENEIDLVSSLLIPNRYTNLGKHSHRSASEHEQYFHGE